MHFITKDLGGQLTIDLPVRPTSGSISVALYKPSGASLTSSASFTTGSVDTALTAAVALGGQSLSVFSTTGMLPTGRLLLDGSEDIGGETVTVKRVSGSLVTLLRPVLSAHVSGATLQSTSVAITVPASMATQVGRHYRAEVNFQDAGVSHAPRVVEFDVVRWNPECKLTVESLRDLDSTLTRKLPPGTSLKALRDLTWDRILSHVANTVDPGAIVDTGALTMAHQYLIRSEMALSAGPDHLEESDRYLQRFRDTLDAAVGSAAIDLSQDGQIGPNDAYRQTIRLIRG